MIASSETLNPCLRNLAERAALIVTMRRDVITAYEADWIARHETAITRTTARILWARHD